MTLQELSNKAMEAGKKEFHFYVNELGLEDAKEIILRGTRHTVLINYVNEYKTHKIEG